MKHEIDGGLLAAGAILALGLTVAGAAGSHMVYLPLTDGELNDSQALIARIESITNWTTAMIFGWAHILASLWTGGGWSGGRGRVKLAGWLFLTGVVLFSGGIMLGTMLEEQFPTLTLPISPTPFGGVAFMAGWVLLVITGVRRAGRSQPKV